MRRLENDGAITLEFICSLVHLSGQGLTDRGAFPGTVYTLSFFPLTTIAPVQLFYNGNKLRKGIDFNISGRTITLTFETQGPEGDTPGDNLYAVYIPVSF